MHYEYTIMCPIATKNKCLFRDHYADNKDVTINQNFTTKDGNTICNITLDDNIPNDSVGIRFDLIPAPCVKCIGEHLGR